tara:strand:+ start:715 stop:1071 length:357 start_codon:yes stop_codon:yes gene_type:complete
MAINKLYRPTPLTPEEYKAMLVKQGIERELRLSKLDDRIVEAKLYCVKGVESFTKTDNILRKQTADERDAYEGIVVVGTERQRCMDKTFPNITGIYSYNLTEDMLKRYEANDNKLIII